MANISLPKLSQKAFDIMRSAVVEDDYAEYTVTLAEFYEAAVRKNGIYIRELDRFDANRVYAAWRGFMSRHKYTYENFRVLKRGGFVAICRKEAYDKCKQDLSTLNRARKADRQPLSR